MKRLATGVLLGIMINGSYVANATSPAPSIPQKLHVSTISTEIIYVVVTDDNGMEVMTKAMIKTLDFTVAFPELNPGTYTVTVFDGQSSHMEKVVIK